ncbi:hypothetical protein NP233_g1613 [Leucocoprinus birnbaumii]|uniref:Uncharacterized protein n=1 Tax=Leucocoprinus birnbaumii TaxID=56174 RepID=A0AAD5YVN2_9AGAR|nr:hypothetical protein NP233_g1613 [Leucocoprinus birnbaumii]
MKGKSCLMFGGLALVGGARGSVFPRAFQTNATCIPANGEDWLWMDNAQQQTPCLAAAFAIGPCVSENYNVVSLAGTTRQYDPSKDQVNSCICIQPAPSMYSVPRITEQYIIFVSTTRPYPANVTIPQGVTFPKWAAQNPTSWPEQRFDGNAAHTFETAHPGDYLDPSSPAANQNGRSGNNVGAIAGGVVGGVLVLAIGIAAALFFYCRSQKRNPQSIQEAPPMAQSPIDYHVRNPSDFSARTGLVYSPFGHTSSPSDSSTARLLNSPTTFHTHNSSRHSFAGDSLMLSYAGTPPPQQVVSMPSNVVTFNGAVVPFTLERPASRNSPLSGHDRKRSEASTEAAAATLSNRSPMNPPAYSEAPGNRADFSSQAGDQASVYAGSSSIVTTPPNNPFRRLHEKSPSVATVNSQRSNESSNGVQTHGASTSFGGAAELISHTNNPETSGAIPAYTGPGPNAVVPRDEKRRRPTVANQSSGDGESHP